MKNRRNYYRILQVQPDAPLEIIRASYRTIMRELMQHPDFGGDHCNAYTINEAYETLSDNVKRAEYDKKYANHFPINRASIKNSINRSFISINKICRNKPASHNTIPDRSSQPDKNLRRSTNRIKMNGSLLSYCILSNKRREAKMLDLSPKGIRFTCSEKLTPKSTIKIGCSTFKAEAEVVNYNKCLSNDIPIYSVGARFLTIKFRNPTGSFYSNFA